VDQLIERHLSNCRIAQSVGDKWGYVVGFASIMAAAGCGLQVLFMYQHWHIVTKDWANVVDIAASFVSACVTFFVMLGGIAVINERAEKLKTAIVCQTKLSNVERMVACSQIDAVPATLELCGVTLKKSHLTGIAVSAGGVVLPIVLRFIVN